MFVTMKAERFAELEYSTLRKEIEISKLNMQKYVVGGSAVILTAQYFADTYAIGAITLALPLIVIVLVLLFLAENHSMMRAGTYILEEIEARIDGVKGWETWLNQSALARNTRSVDKLVVVSFAVVAASYFLASVLLAGRYALVEFGTRGRFILLVAYIGIGLVFAAVLYRQAKTNTTAA